MKFSSFKAWLEIKTGFKFADDLKIVEDSYWEGLQRMPMLHVSMVDVKPFKDDRIVANPYGLAFHLKGKECLKYPFLEFLGKRSLISQEDAKKLMVQKFFTCELEAWRRPDILKSKDLARKLGPGESDLTRIIRGYAKMCEAMECSESQVEMELAVRGI